MVSREAGDNENRPCALTTPSGKATAAFRCSSVVTSTNDSPVSVAAFFAASEFFDEHGGLIDVGATNAAKDDYGGDFCCGLRAILRLDMGWFPKNEKGPGWGRGMMRSRTGSLRHGGTGRDRGGSEWLMVVLGRLEMKIGDLGQAP